MELENRILRGNTVEEYRILLRAVAELSLPTEYPGICTYYLSLAEKCLAWATDVTGERLRSLYTALESHTERSRFPTGEYRFRMTCDPLEADFAAIVCETHLLGIPGEERIRRLSHVWCLSEETVLPVSQILKRYFRGQSKLGVGFVPDGVYPSGEELIAFKNSDGGGAPLEKRFPRA